MYECMYVCMYVCMRACSLSTSFFLFSTLPGHSSLFVLLFFGCLAILPVHGLAVKPLQPAARPISQLLPHEPELFSLEHSTLPVQRIHFSRTCCWTATCRCEPRTCLRYGFNVKSAPTSSSSQKKRSIYICIFNIFLFIFYYFYVFLYIDM